MSSDNRSPNARSSPPASTLLVEWVVVGSVLVSLAATFVAVVAFMANGAKRHEAAEPEPPADIVSAAFSAASEVPAVKVQAPVEATPAPAPGSLEPPPDSSVDQARELERRIASARNEKARADLLAWSARKAADWLDRRAQRAEAAAGDALSAGENAAADAARLRGYASDLADAVARLELKRDDAAARFEAAKNRKGFSILPYRGQSGAWQRPLPIECARDSAQIMPGGPTFRLIDLELSGLSPNSLFARIVELAMRKAAAQATPDGNAPTVYVLFVVRPSGIKAYYEARARLQAQGVAFGYELVSETTPIEYPDLGDLSEWPGYVPPDDIADAVLADSARPPSAPAFSTSGAPSGRGGQATTGNAAGVTDGDTGLFVWRNGLDARRPVPGDGQTGGAPSNRLGARSGDPAGTSAMGAGDGSESPPRVDFGSATPGQRGRPGGIGRGPGFPGLTESREPGGISTAPGTFEDLVAELAARENSGPARSLTRPGAVAILPGDLADDLDGAGQSPLGRGGLFSGSSGGQRMGGANSGPGQGGGIPGLPRSPSPFGTTPPTLPRFEPAPGPGGSLAAGGGPGVAGTSAEYPRVPGTGGQEAGPPVEGTSSPGKNDHGEMNESAGANPGNGGAAGNGSFGAQESGAWSGEDPGRIERIGAGSASNAGNTADSSGPAGASRGANSAGSEASPESGRGQRSAASGGVSSGGQESGEGPKFGLRNSFRRIFGNEDRLPEKAWEVNLTCDADGITVRPGEHRISLNDMQVDPDLLPRTLQSMFERHVREHPERFWRPYVKYRLAAGGEPLMGLSQQQLAAGFVRWPAVFEPVANSGREVTR